MFMADSLNTGIQKLGDTLSAKLFGNSKDNPEGSDNFSGIYIGPGGGVTKMDMYVSVRDGGTFLPPGYFDSNNSWVDDQLSSIIEFLPGISRDDFPLIIKDSRSGKDIEYSEPSGPYKHIGNGFTPPGFFIPRTGLWVDGRFSTMIAKYTNGQEGNSIQRTFQGDLTTINDLSVSPGKSLEDPDGILPIIDGVQNKTSAAAGFTPVAYYRTGKEIFLQPNSLDGNAVGIVTTKESLDYSKKRGTDGFYDGVSDSDYSFKYGIEDDNLESSFPGRPATGFREFYQNLKKDIFTITPYDNEDPLFIGFEIIINAPTSPLFNGELLNFIRKFYSYSEISSRDQIYSDFVIEALKFFKFNNEEIDGVNLRNLGITPNPNGVDIESIFKTRLKARRHYVKKIKGLDKLNEANTPSQQAAFVKYKNDLVTLTFYEDTTLEFGTLASLYKLLYWSRIRGKNIIPENLLRFDCTVIVSEVRNFTRVKRASETGQLETLKENVSRYVYDLYECQLFFDKLSHGDSVANDAIASPEGVEVSFSYKFSTSRFERYNFDDNKYKSVDNRKLRPQDETSQILDPLNNGYSGKDIVSSLISSRFESINSEAANSSTTTEAETQGSSDINNLKNNEKLNIYKSEFEKAVLEGGGSNIGIYPSLSAGDSENSIPLNQNGNLLKRSGEALLQNIKKAALNEAQRQLNSQFRLVNNSLDKVRNSFGIGRMSEPTNVYNNPPGGQFFFDVKNSLRNFGGDILGGLLGG
jgi:hypothetical protein